LNENCNDENNLDCFLLKHDVVRFIINQISVQLKLRMRLVIHG